jgi:DNA-binding HxlR family transcriptional regulator
MRRTVAELVASCNASGIIRGVLKSTYEGQNCSVAAALEVIGERWTLLVVRDLFLGTRRFDEFQRNLGIARNVLQARLTRLVDAGIVTRTPYQERPLRHEYRLTEKGLDLWPVLHALRSWGDRHTEGEPPVIVRHRGCGGAMDDRRTCEACGAVLGPADVVATRGPGAGLQQDRLPSAA